MSSRYDNLGVDAKRLQSHIAGDAVPNRRRDLHRHYDRVIAAAGVRVRLNYPYRGTADVLTKTLRLQLPSSTYAGLELELNQRVFGDRVSRTHILGVTRESFLAIVCSTVQPAR